MVYQSSLDYAFFYDLPLWVVAIPLAIIMIAAVEAGYELGIGSRIRSGLSDADRGGGAIVLTSLFALLGLLLAFTYSAAVDRHEARRLSILNEANALSTAFLRADVLTEPYRTDLKQALFDYALTRVVEPNVNSAEMRLAATAETLEKQQIVWPITRSAIAAETRIPIATALLNSINNVMDLHLIRFEMSTNKLPAPIFFLLIMIAAMSLTLAGFVAGVQAQIGRWRLYGFAIVLSSLILITIDFDRPTDGLIQIHGASIEAALEDMRLNLGDDIAR